MSEEQAYTNKDRLKGKEDIKNAVLAALRAGATRENANQLKPIVQQVESINVGNDEQWEILLKFSDKVVAFKESGNIKDLS